VVVWFLDGSGKVVDVVQGQAGVNDVELHANVLRSGQPKQFDLFSPDSSSSPQVAQIKAVKAVAYTQEVPLPARPS
jgi:hypothetical protein